MAILTDTTTASSNDWNEFDPKDKQKAVYRWYDSRYSDEALDIYSKKWQQRILEWHRVHQVAVVHFNKSMTSKDQLNSMDFGIFFLAHPIAAFSLSQVLEACYELDLTVCGDIDEVASWRALTPFSYLESGQIRDRWEIELERLRGQVKNPLANFKRQSWKASMYEILIGVEKFDSAFATLRENFKVNLEGMEFASWMTEVIEQGVGERFTLATELLSFKDNELESMRHTESREEEMSRLSKRTTEQIPSPSDPEYATPVEPDFEEDENEQTEVFRSTPVPMPDPVQKTTENGGFMSMIKSRVKRTRRKLRKYRRKG